ncbi:transposase [Streptomyces sp. NBC_00885]|uniref:transposase n=1 Tax=Streptomyces sp. NBC_00885 TaxID=2975857 RepID=UPI003869C771
MTDTLGLLLLVAVTAANVPDRDAAAPVLERLRAVHRDITLVWADGGYTGGLIDWVHIPEATWTIHPRSAKRFAFDRTPFDLRRPRPEPQRHRDVLGPHRLRPVLKHAQDPLVVRRESRRGRSFPPGQHDSSRHRGGHRHRFPGRRLPQILDPLTGIRLPRLQQSQHRRHHALLDDQQKQDAETLPHPNRNHA